MQGCCHERPILIRLGLTGSIGMGKSTTSTMFREAGVPVYDADAAVHTLYRGAGVAAVEGEFPGVTVNGAVDRQLLSSRVINDAAALARLEKIVHPLLGASRSAFFDAVKKSGSALCVLDVPLLFETGGERNVDVIAVVSAGADVQRARVLGREGMNPEKLAVILGKQMSDVEKRRRAHFVIDTGQGLAYARRQVVALVHALAAR